MCNAFSYCGNFILVGTDKGQILVISAQTGNRLVHIKDVVPSPILQLWSDRKSKFIGALSDSALLCHYSFFTGKLLRTTALTKERVLSTSISGNLLATYHADFTLRITDLRNAFTFRSITLTHFVDNIIINSEDDIYFIDSTNSL